MKLLVDKHQCYFCNICEPLNIPITTKKFRKLIEIHHIVESNMGGEDKDYNLVPVCSNCHSKIHLGLINPKKWFFTTSGWKLSWADDKGNGYFGRPKNCINS